MPIEIKELHIRIAVNTSQNGQPSGNETANDQNSSRLTSDNAKEMLVAECVEQVLQILKNKKER